MFAKTPLCMYVKQKPFTQSDACKATRLKAR